MGQFSMEISGHAGSILSGNQQQGSPKFRLQEMIEGKKNLRIEAKGRDRFGRPLVNVYLPDGREVGKELIREGFAREWRKGRKIDWCG